MGKKEVGDGGLGSDAPFKQYAAKSKKKQPHQFFFCAADEDFGSW